MSELLVLLHCHPNVLESLAEGSHRQITPVEGDDGGSSVGVLVEMVPASGLAFVHQYRVLLHATRIAEVRNVWFRLL